MEITRAINAQQEYLIARLVELQSQATRLKCLDPANATPSYHRDAHGEPRYLWLIYPQRNGERKREYIGSKPDKITAALARVQAHRDLVEAQTQTADIKARLALVTRLLGRALQVAQEKEV